MKNIKKAFTLIELLLVVGLMATLMGIALPAFSKMAKGNGITLASRTISGKINGARAYAITKRAYVGLVFATVGGEAVGDVPNVIRNTCCRPAIFTYASSNYTFVKWVDGEGWEKMPTGVTFGGDASSGKVGALSTGVSVPMPKSAFNDLDSSFSGSTIANVNCLMFTPGGMTKNTGFSISIWEATATSVGTQPTITNTNNYVKITINRFTGRLSYGS